MDAGNMEPTPAVDKPSERVEEAASATADPDLGTLVGLADKWGGKLPPPLLYFALIVLLLIIAGLVFGFRKIVTAGDEDVLSVMIVFGLFVLIALAMLLGTLIIIKTRVLPVVEKEREERERSEAALDVAERRLEAQPTLQELERGLAKRFADGGGATIAWIRMVPRLPLPQTILDSLQQELTRLRAAASTALADIGIPISANLVRANIFIPDSRRAEVGQVCGLYIPKGLHVNMQDAKERDLIFRPDEGLTGRVFVEEEAEGAVYDANTTAWRRVTFFGPPPDPQDGPDYTLTEYQQQLISDRLRWVVSFPIKVPDVDKETTVCVVNVDGLDVELAPEKMKDVFLRLATSEIPKVSAILADAKFDRVAILLAKGV